MHLLRFMLIAGFLFAPQMMTLEIQDAFQLWLFILAPSLFPFLFLGEWLIARGWMQAAGILVAPWMARWFRIRGETGCAVLIGFLSGYPMAARLLGELYDRRRIDADEVRRVIGWATTADPVFMAGAVATGMLGHTEWALVLIVIHFSSAITLALLSGLRTRRENHHLIFNSWADRKTEAWHVIQQRHFSSSQKESLLKMLLRSAKILVLIAGMVIVCSAASGFLQWIINRWVTSELLPGMIFASLLEVSVGVNQFASTAFAPGTHLMIVSAILAWGGLSVHVQVLGFVKQVGVKWYRFALSKALHALTSVFYCWIFLKTGMVPKTADTSIFNENMVVFANGWYEHHPFFMINRVEIVKTVIVFSFILICYLVYWCMKSTDTTLRWDHDEKCDECESSHRATGAHRTVG